MATWTGLGGSIISDPAVNQFNNRLQVFAQGTDNGLWTIREAEPGTWSSWVSLGGVATVVGTPTVGLNADGRFEVFWRGPEGFLRHVVQTAPDSASWSTSEMVGVSMFPITSDPVVVRDSD
jgi:hypothetical protein